MSTVEEPIVLGKREWEFSKRMTFTFIMIFAMHLTALIISAVMVLGDYRLIKDSFMGTLPFYGIIFGGYTTKATLENFSKYNKEYQLTVKEMDIKEVELVEEKSAG